MGFEGEAVDPKTAKAVFDLSIRLLEEALKGTQAVGLPERAGTFAVVNAAAYVCVEHYTDDDGTFDRDAALEMFGRLMDHGLVVVREQS